MLHYCFRDATSRCLISSILMTRKSYSHCHKALYLVALASCCWGLQLREKAATNFTRWQLDCIVHTIQWIVCTMQSNCHRVKYLDGWIESTHQDIQVILSTDFLSRFSEEQITSDSDTLADLLQELIRRWDTERGTLTQCTRKQQEFAEITQNNGHYAVQGHSRSPISVPIESSYTISY